MSYTYISLVTMFCILICFSSFDLIFHLMSRRYLWHRQNCHQCQIFSKNIQEKLNFIKMCTNWQSLPSWKFNTSSSKKTFIKSFHSSSIHLSPFFFFLARMRVCVCVCIQYLSGTMFKYCRMQKQSLMPCFTHEELNLGEYKLLAPSQTIRWIWN